MLLNNLNASQIVDAETAEMHLSVVNEIVRAVDELRIDMRVFLV